MEVGMGGRLDATNIIAPDACVITQISYDHMDYLGKTLKDISREKAGIIKTGIPVVSAFQEPEAMDIIQMKAIEHNAELSVMGGILLPAFIGRMHRVFFLITRMRI